MSSTYVDGSTPLDAAHMNALQQKVEKGLANGYAGLDSAGFVVAAQIPTTVQLKAEKAAANGYASLDANSKVPVAQLPGSELTYAQFAVNVSITATTEAGATIIATAGAVTVDGSTQIVVEFFAIAIQPVSGGSLTLYLFQDGTSLGSLSYFNNATASAVIFGSVHPARRLLPAAGSPVFSVRASTSSGTGTVFAGAGGAAANLPGFIRITRAS